MNFIRLTNEQTSIAVGRIRAFQANMKYNNSVTFILILFTRNRIRDTVQIISVAQTPMMARTTRLYGM